MQKQLDEASQQNQEEMKSLSEETTMLRRETRFSFVEQQWNSFKQDIRGFNCKSKCQ